MLTVKTYIDKSKISGIGLFAKEDIKKGTVVWRLNPVLDILLPFEEFFKLDKITRRFLNFYDYDLNRYVVCLGDNARFVNHSSNPNLAYISVTEEIAIKNIKKGKELTEDYRQHHKRKLPKSYK